MSRSSDAYSEHMQKMLGGTTQVQPEKCQAAKVEKAVAFLAELGFTVVTTQSKN